MEQVKHYPGRVSVLYRIVFLCAMLCPILWAPSWSSEPTSSESPYFIDGYDVVSYFRDSGPLLGKKEHSLSHDEHTLLFNTRENLLQFQSDPDSYMPAYNGYCAYGMVFGMKSKVDPLQYDIIDGQLYLQLDRGTKRRFNRRLGRNLKKSKRAWTKLIASSSTE